MIGDSDKIHFRINFPSLPRQLEETMVRRILVEYSMKLLFYFSFSSNKSLTHLEREKIDQSKDREKN